ncbi:MAG: DNA topoisomerase I [Asgard group archaeon]|nr:DNA topoisomerase I [Asgard group archaeon]
MAHIKKLHHNGINFVETPYHELHIYIKGEKVKLTPKQEQMAIAWVKKLSTQYVEDEVFCENFFEDFAEALGYDSLTDEDVDFSPVMDFVEAERKKKEQMTKEEKKKAREQRKEEREKKKEYYGTALLNGKKAEIQNYTAEPSSIFMGRGKHPLRGKWKEGPSIEDVILNLSPDAPIPEGNWKDIVWEPDCLWVAKWKDKLSGKIKYVWLSDNTPIKQDREREKFDEANRIADHLSRIRKEIMKGIKSDDKEIQKIATACYIIDRLNLRVGDEKDDDEADTVGATTLRPEHVTINGEKVRFNFRGKDYVEWNKEATLPKPVLSVLKELMKEAEKRGTEKPQIFNNIGSKHVNDFLGEKMEGLTAKMFRTFHATQAVKEYLENDDVDKDDPDFLKKEAATLANREAAIICNHVKQEPKNWDDRLERFKDRRDRAQERIDKAVAYKQKRIDRLEEVKQKLAERKEMKKERMQVLKKEKKELKELKTAYEKETNEEEKENLEKEIERAKKRVKRKKKRVETANKRIDTAKRQLKKAREILGRAKERLYKANLNMEKVKAKERMAKQTKTWNLNTSLKSYIDPRVYYEWGQEVDYDWRNYYTKALERKFSWVERDNEDELEEQCKK